MATGGGPADRAVRYGISTAPAAADAVEELFAAIGQPAMGVVAVFCSPSYDRDALQAHLARRFAGTTLVGCTTSGEISSLGYTDGGLAGISIARDQAFAVSQLLPDLSRFQPSDGREAAVALLQDLKRMGAQPSAQNTFGFLLVDGMSFMEERVISALSTGLGTIPVFGGSAGDGRRHDRTFVFHDGRFHPDAAVLTLVHTQLPFKVFSTNHFVSTDQQAIVTAADSERRIVFELNGESAAREYADLVGRPVEELRADNSMLPPLVVRIGGASYARSIERVNADNSLQLACAIDEGVPLSVARNTGMLQNLRQVFADVRRAIGPPQAVIGMDCFMRRVEAGATGITTELAGVFAENGVIGFSAYGEQINAMHLNHTLTGVAIGFGGQDKPLPAPPPAEEGEVGRLERENGKLRKTVRVLLQRLERSMDVPGDTFSLFQNNVLLEETVRKRTEELAELNRQLNLELTKRREIEIALTLAKREAEQANHSKTQFLAAISHDLQQPLNSARLMLGALAEDMPAPGGRALCSRIEGALETAEEMVADFLDVARLEAGAIACNPTIFPVGPLLAQLAAEYLPQARRRGLSLNFVPTTAVVRTDRHLLQRILRNLLSNALRYTPRGGVLLGCRRRQGTLSVEIWDSGIGIPERHQKEIFRAFCRLDDGRLSSERGAGLGLTIVERIAQVLGLPVRLRSRAGHGSGFMIGVPMAALDNERAVQAAAPPMAQSPLVGKRILVLDDDAGAGASLVQLLQAWGCEAMAVTTPAAALERLAPVPDIFIVDYHLGQGRTGLQAIADAEARLDAPLRALVVSGDSSAEVAEAVRAAGRELLVKPVKPARLRSVASYLLLSQN